MQSDSKFEFGKPDQATQRGSLTVGMLFYFMTLGGIISACLATLVGNAALTDEALTRVLLITVGIGFLSGGVIGFYYLKSRKAALIGCCAGILVGAVAGGLALVRAEHFTQIMLIAFGGCALLMLVMLLAMRFSKPIE